MLAPLFMQAMLAYGLSPPTPRKRGVGGDYRGFAEAWFRRVKAGAWLQHSKVVFSFLDNSRIWDALKKFYFPLDIRFIYGIIVAKIIRNNHLMNLDL